jgi:hypothetical protein
MQALALESSLNSRHRRFVDGKRQMPPHPHGRPRRSRGQRARQASVHLRKADNACSPVLASRQVVAKKSHKLLKCHDSVLDFVELGVPSDYSTPGVAHTRLGKLADWVGCPAAPGPSCRALSAEVNGGRQRTAFTIPRHWPAYLPSFMLLTILLTKARSRSRERGFILVYSSHAVCCASCSHDR